MSESVQEDVDRFRTSALSSVSFIAVYNEEDLKKTHIRKQFKPAMAHQIFGESEYIFGYENLSIDLYFSHNSLQWYTHIKYSNKIKTCEADDIDKALKQWLPENYVKDETTFLEIVNKEQHHRMFGTVIDEFEKKSESLILPDTEQICSYKITLGDLEDESFKELHSRFETFIIWFIDGGNFLDLSDEKWIIFYIYEESKHPVTNETFRTPIGFCTIYKFFSYPNNIRSRISQFFILPTHQRKGLGSAFYNAICKKLRSMSEVIDITVEDAEESFQNMRNYCDSLYVYKDLKANNLDIMKMHSKHLFQYLGRHKICKLQSKKIIDILQYLVCTKEGVESCKTFVNNLKFRIEEEMSRELMKSARLLNLSMDETEIKTSMEEQQKSKLSNYLDSLKVVVKKMLKCIDK